MDNKFTKADYEKAAKEARGLPPFIERKNGERIYISDLLENAITNIEIIEKYLHSIDPVISKRCQNCGQKLRVKINDNEFAYPWNTLRDSSSPDKSEHRLDN